MREYLVSVPAASTLGSLVEWALLMTSLRSSTRHASLIAGEEEKEEEEEEEEKKAIEKRRVLLKEHVHICNFIFSDKWHHC